MAALLPGFYTLLQSDNINATDCSTQVMLNPQHPVYGGHFPGQPVVPGVCILQIIKECLEEICHTTLQYKQIASCKFLSAINPNETPELNFSFILKKNEDDVFQLLVEGTSAKGIFIKLKAQLTDR